MRLCARVPIGTNDIYSGNCNAQFFVWLHCYDIVQFVINIQFDHPIDLCKPKMFTFDIRSEMTSVHVHKYIIDGVEKLYTFPFMDVCRIQ